ncbi:MAG: hypothetical protein JO115_08070 [Pseudonocardiales bacterium]|nr:hypothetical protein [Pseudonocardiales bacterium]
MQHKDGPADQDTDDPSQNTGQPAQRGIGLSLRPGTSVPPRVLVSDLGDGSLLLQGWRDGPSAHLNPADAVPLRRELAAAFECPELAVHGDQDDAR